MIYVYINLIYTGVCITIRHISRVTPIFKQTDNDEVVVNMHLIN